MKSATLVGILLIGLGVVGLLFGGIEYTKNRQVADIGPIEMNVEEKETIPLPPILGGLAVAGGIALLIAGTRKS